jgi:hypothetical protein
MFSCPKCRSDLVLRIAKRGEHSGEYFWGCESYPACQFVMNSYVKAQPGDDYPVKVLSDWQEIVFSNALKDESYIKIAMPMLLEHFIGCNLGRCWTAIYSRFIRPYLDNPTLLQETLLSGLLDQNKGNTISSDSGTPIFYDLFVLLYNVESADIRSYLEQDFPSYVEQRQDDPYVPKIIGD